MPLSNFESNLVDFLEQEYRLSGRFLSAEKCHADYGIPVRDYERALNNTEVKEALTERGIVFERFNDDFTAATLTTEQLFAANSILDLTDTRTAKKKLQDLGVSTLKYDAWLKDPVFKSYLQTRAENMLGDAKHEAAMALMDKVRAGDTKAIEFYYEFTGTFTRQKSGSNVDVYALITQLLEVIDEEVDDPETLRRLSIRIKGLIAKRNTTNALLGIDEDVIVVPEVVKGRDFKELVSDTGDAGPVNGSVQNSA
jgi:hypothetical protein